MLKNHVMIEGKFWKENVKKKGSLPEGERIKEKATRSDSPSLEKWERILFFLGFKNNFFSRSKHIVNLEEKGFTFLYNYI